MKMLSGSVIQLAAVVLLTVSVRTVPAQDVETLDADIALILAAHPSTLTSVGRFGSKMYFSDNSATKDFNGACAFCTRLGMKVVSVDTPDEFNYLISKLTPSYRYYTSGQNVPYFEWGNGRRVSIHYSGTISPTCLQVYNKVLSAVPCTTTSTSYPLCEV